MVEEGKPAPDFELTSDGGEDVKLSDFRGKPVVLYFYPKDDTPGCTKQACGIRDAYGEFERAGAVVLGVSPDDERGADDPHVRLAVVLLLAPDAVLLGHRVVGIGEEREGQVELRLELDVRLGLVR